MTLRSPVTIVLVVFGLTGCDCPQSCDNCPAQADAAIGVCADPTPGDCFDTTYNVSTNACVTVQRPVGAACMYNGAPAICDAAGTCTP